jgi:hypothetical protein
MMQTKSQEAGKWEFRIQAFNRPLLWSNSGTTENNHIWLILPGD